MHIGARVIKSGAAVTVAVYVASLLGIEATLFAAFTAAFAIQPNFYRSFQTLLEQLNGTFMGVGVATAIFFVAGNDPVIVGFSVIIILAICTFFQMNDNTISMSLFGALAIMLNQGEEIIPLAGTRFAALSTGVVSAFIINMIFAPPKYELKLFKSIDQATSDILQWLRISTRHLSDEPALRIEINRLSSKLWKIEDTYLLFKEERIYRRKNIFPKLRKLVLFKQLIKSSRKSLEILDAVSQYDQKVEEIPIEFQQVLVGELDKLIYSHERLLLNVMGKIKKQPTKSVDEITNPDIPNLAESLFRVYKEENEESITLLPLASRLMEYHQEILHLQKIINSYQKFHGKLNYNFKKNNH